MTLAEYQPVAHMNQKAEGKQHGDNHGKAGSTNGNRVPVAASGGVGKFHQANLSRRRAA